MIVGLNLETQCPATIKINYASIILKNGKTPRLLQLLSCLHNSILEQVIYSYLTKLDFTLKCFVDTVLRPSLRQGLKLGISGVSPFFLKVGYNSPKLIISKSKLLLNCHKSGAI
ncbi:hypothetical protein ES703_123807 [subsurface metagenome]